MYQESGLPEGDKCYPYTTNSSQIIFNLDLISQKSIRQKLEKDEPKIREIVDEEFTCYKKLIELKGVEYVLNKIKESFLKTSVKNAELSAICKQLDAKIFLEKIFSLHELNLDHLIREDPHLLKFYNEWKFHNRENFPQLTTPKDHLRVVK